MNTADLIPERRGGETITRIPWNAIFHCYEPFPTAREYSSSLKTVTSSPDSDIVNNPGTAPARPVFVISANSATVTVVNVRNDTTGEEIQWSGTLAAGDVLTFDGEEEEVTKNGTEVVFSGSFPTLDPGDNDIHYTITGSPLNLDCTTKFKPPYR